MNKIGMIAAMTGELNALLERMDGVEEISSIGNRKVLLARLAGKELYIIESGVGEILSASAAQHLISAYGVEAIINFGVCGSLKKKHGVKKTVLLEGVVHYEIDTTAIDDVEVGRYFFLPSKVIPLSEELLEKASALRPDLERVVCASGNKFVARESEKIYLSEQFGADVCEMEAAGIALTCHTNGIPCLMVKAVSDGEGGAEEFKATVFEASRVYISLVLDLLKIL
ncbi:MAG: 5'-methylthioadenosine/S-adenosylhomocysteine nucleosidase [Clostridia bacterium]|nr:5'-methylthioadenosine/S-adenosylhomocysteine nucleosidase [Clostridia bacterium]